MALLNLIYDASALTYRVRVEAVEEFIDAKGELTVQTTTGPHPETLLTTAELRKLAPELAERLAADLRELETVARQKIESDIASPDQLKAMALSLQLGKLELQKERERHEAAVAEAKAIAAAEEENAKQLRRIQEEATRDAEAKAAAAAKEHERIAAETAKAKADAEQAKAAEAAAHKRREELNAELRELNAKLASSRKEAAQVSTPEATEASKR